MREKRKSVKPLYKLTSYMVDCQLFFSYFLLDFGGSRREHVNKIKWNVQLFKGMLALTTLNINLWKLRQGHFHYYNLPMCLFINLELSFLWWLAKCIWSVLLLFSPASYLFLQFSLPKQSRWGKIKEFDNSVVCSKGILPQYVFASLHLFFISIIIHSELKKSIDF